MSEKPLRFMKSIENLPEGTKGGDSFYDEIVREFLYSGVKYAVVKDLGKKPLTVYLSLKNRSKKRKGIINVSSRNGKVYLERLDSPQQAKLLPSEHNKTSVTSYSNENPAIEVVTLLNTSLVKAKCPNCKTLNNKDSRVCVDCRGDLYLTEQEYQNALEKMEVLEKTLNCQN